MENLKSKIRNIAIIAHVDHGKTTLVDTLFQQSGIFREGQVSEIRSMDSNALEKERGITILSKSTSIRWKDYTINILDTPGHSDFGSEVERVLMMADAVLLIVDAVEGVMPQTKFVMSKALQNKLKIIIFINKVDRVNADSLEEIRNVTNNAMNEVTDLIYNTCPETALEAPIFFGSGRSGFASESLEKVWIKEVNNVNEILDKIIDYCPEPKINGEDLQFLVSMIDLDPYFGKLLIGKMFGGKLNVGDTIISKTQDNNKRESFRINKIFGFQGTKRIEKEFAIAGDIICISGGELTTVGDMVCSDMETEIIKAPKIDPPTLSIMIGANTSPLSGKDGTNVTIRKIKDYLLREAETNVGISVIENGDQLLVKGRGELQLSVLLETMRREGFELMVNAPQVVYIEENGKKMEPQEKVFIDVDQEYSSIVIRKLGERGGQFINMVESKTSSTYVRLIFEIPTKYLLGYFTEFMSDTKGTGILNKEFDKYIPIKENRRTRTCGLLIATEEGKANAYAMDKLQERGSFFIPPDVEVYKGMIVGEHNKENDLHVNLTKSKQLTNVRASGKDDAIRLPPPMVMTLEKAITYISGIEKVEITPKRICLLKIER